MGIVIDDELLAAARMSEDEVKLELAVLLYQKEKLSLAQAARVAGIDRIRFQHLLASRSIPVNYDAREFESDRKTVDSMP